MVKSTKKNMRWMNEPEKWKTKGDDIKVTVPMETDMWRGTLHGFIKDDAPFYWMMVEGMDFEARLSIKGKFKYLYDQASMMIRVDDENWMKCGICHYRDQLYVDCNFTRGNSDWSTHRLPKTKIDKFHVWLKRKGPIIECFYSLDNENWIQIRRGHFSSKPRLRVGMMCAAPESAGFKVTFSNFLIKNNSNPEPEGEGDDAFEDKHALEKPSMALLPPSEGGTLGVTNWDEEKDKPENEEPLAIANSAHNTDDEEDLD